MKCKICGGFITDEDLRIHGGMCGFCHSIISTEEHFNKINEYLEYRTHHGRGYDNECKVCGGFVTDEDLRIHGGMCGFCHSIISTEEHFNKINKYLKYKRFVKK